MECDLLKFIFSLAYILDLVIYERSTTGFMNTDMFLLWTEHSCLPEVRDR